MEWHCVYLQQQIQKEDAQGPIHKRGRPKLEIGWAFFVKHYLLSDKGIELLTKNCPQKVQSKPKQTPQLSHKTSINASACDQEKATPSGALVEFLQLNLSTTFGPNYPFFFTFDYAFFSNLIIRSFRIWLTAAGKKLIADSGIMQCLHA